MDTTAREPNPGEIRMIDYNIPAELGYTADDEWVRSHEELVTIGVTDFAQEQLGISRADPQGATAEADSAEARL